MSLLWLIGIGTYLALVLARDLADPGRLAHRDFFCFYRAGELVLGGGTGYEAVERTFANPPFALPLVQALGLLSPAQAFFACNLVGLAGCLVGMLALARIAGIDPRFRVTAVVLAVANPSFVFALHLGQWTGLYLGLFGLAVYGMAERRDTLAGVAAGLLWLKPPLALAVIGLGTLTRPRAFTLAWLATLAVLVLVSLPYGLEAWEGWRAALDALVARHEDTPDSWRKQYTVYAFVRSLLARVGGSRELARGIAILVAALYGAALVRAIWRSRAVLESSVSGRARTVRLASIALLTTIALNLYIFYYDAAIVVIPTLFLFTHRASWRSTLRWRLAVGCAVLVWLLELLPMLWTGGPSAVGPVSLAWAILELVELEAARQAGPSETVEKWLPCRSRGSELRG